MFFYEPQHAKVTHSHQNHPQATTNTFISISNTRIFLLRVMNLLGFVLHPNLADLFSGQQDITRQQTFDLAAETGQAF